MTKKQFLMGNRIIVEAALAAGAEMLTGYPITPTTEVLEEWAREAERTRMSTNNSLKTTNKKVISGKLAGYSRPLVFLQTEDEMAAGFTALGGVLAGRKAFTVTAGPGNVLLQDALGMAEAMRIPLVVIIGQRGGPSTGTVIYSQQEVVLTTHGAHGEGHRIVYSPSNLQELYDYTIKAFNSAWQYRFPTFILSDGYLEKTKGGIELRKPKKIVPSYSFFSPQKPANLRNCYSLEEELFEDISQREKDFRKAAPKIIKYEIYGDQSPEILIFAHGIVGAAAKAAIARIKSQVSGIKVGLFRPLTLSPFPEKEGHKLAQSAKKILVIESSLGQFETLVKKALYGLDIPIASYLRPALGITPEEIMDEVHKQIITNK